MDNKITNNIFYVGSKNPDLRIFDVIMHTKYGTSYNAYVVKGKDKIALVETVKDKHTKEFLEEVAKVVPLDQIDYVVMSHTEPDHSGSLNEFLQHAPNATVVATKSAHNFLKEITNNTYKEIVAKEGDTLDLGGLTMEFIMAPFLHWPDTMFTYIKEDKVLITGDMFGCHYACKGIFDNEFSPELIDAQKYYFDVIISPFKDHALNAINKIVDLDFDIVCPSHGPVLKHQPHEAIARFKEWSRDILHTNEKKRVIIAYVSAYGYTKELAEIAKLTLVECGIDARIYEITSSTPAELMEKIDLADGVLIGSPTFNRDALPPVWTLLMHFSAFRQKKMPAAAFGSFGWSGEAVKMLSERMRSLGLNVVNDGYRTRFKPSDTAKEEMKEFAKSFVEHL